MNCPGWPYNNASLKYRHIKHNISRQVLDLEPTSVPDALAGTFQEGTGGDEEYPPAPPAPASPSGSSSSD